MLTREYIPTPCRGKNAEVTGSVRIRMPSFDEKYKYIEECGFEMDPEGNIVGGMQQLPAIRKMVSLTKDHYEEVKLECTKDGTKFSTFDEMQYDSRCDNILIEVASQIIGGFRAGKS